MQNILEKFQRLINSVIQGVKAYETYIDDIVIYNDSWNMMNRFISSSRKYVQEAKT